MNIHIKNCSACHKDHDAEIKKLKKPLHDTGLVFTHYAICKDTGKTILVTKEDIADARVEE